MVQNNDTHPKSHPYYTVSPRYAILVTYNTNLSRGEDRERETTDTQELLHLSLRSQRKVAVAHPCERSDVPSNPYTLPPHVSELLPLYTAVKLKLYSIVEEASACLQFQQNQFTCIIH